MRKTQQVNNKTSFKGILNLQNEKLPEKKSRSRSIRDRNNTTSNQYSYSRATQNDNKSYIQGGQPELNVKNRKLSMKNDISNVSRIEQNRSNLSRNQSSIEKIRQNMRKQSQQIKENQRKRSHSQKRRSQNKNKQNSISHPASKFPKAVTRDNPSSNQQLTQRTSEQQLMNQIKKIKNKISSIQRSYEGIGNQVNSLKKDQNSSNYYQNQSNTEKLNQQQELKQKANDLNNILQSFHIKFKESITKNTKQLINKIDQFQERTSNKQNIQNNIADQKQNSDQQFSPHQIDSMFNQIEKQFFIGKYNNSNQSLFQKLKNDGKTSFSDLEKKMILVEQRLFK